jgi:hypothetical protein
MGRCCELELEASPVNWFEAIALAEQGLGGQQREELRGFEKEGVGERAGEGVRKSGGRWRTERQEIVGNIGARPYHAEFPRSLKSYLKSSDELSLR